MKKSKINMLSIIASALSSIFILSGCGNKNKETGTSGLVTIAGSTALQPLVEQAGEQFGEQYPDAIINVQGGGSGTGLTQVIQGAIDIGNSDITAEDKLDKEHSDELVDHKVCVVGFGVVVNNKVKIDNLRSEDLIKIFTGQIINWKEVGGNDLSITVINRPKSSGTRASFKKYALSGKSEAEGKVLTQDSSGAVQKTIATNEGSIGYLASSFLNEPENLKGMKILKIDGVEMNKENITNGEYNIWSYEHMYTKGEPRGLTKTFLDYMVSDEVKPLVEKLGYIPINDMKVSR